MDLYLCFRFVPDEDEAGYPENSNLNRVMRSVMTVKKSSVYYESCTIGERTTALLKEEEIVKLRRRGL